MTLAAALPMAPTWALTTGGFVIDTQDRFLVRAFHNSVYAVSAGAAPTWNGSVAGCTPGTTDPAFRDLVLVRVNYFRAMAGVPAAVAFDAGFNAQAQAAALLMSANNNLSHEPPTSWNCWSQAGSDGAGHSNLSLGYLGPDAVAGQMRDDGANNAAAGHRRWILYPQTATMGTGDVPASGQAPAAHALFVWDDRYHDPRPATREAFVAWPPPGYVPYQLVYPRWSFSYAGADFSAATVTMVQSGTTVTPRLEPVAELIGENTLVWVPPGRDPSGARDTWVAPTADTTYDITIENVRIGPEIWNFDYSVVVIDPARPGANEVVPSVSGPAQVYAGRTTDYTVAAVPHAIGYQLSTLDLLPHARLDGAEPGTLGTIIDGTTTNYNLVSTTVRASGTASFHLAHPTPVPQHFALRDRFLVGAGATWRFKTRLGWSTSDQIARAQVSLDDGRTWQDLYTQAGTRTAGATTFTARTVSLAPFAGRIINLRFLYDFSAGSYYPQTQDGVGLYVDDIAIEGVERIATEGLQDLGNPTFSATAPTAGTRGYRVRTRLWSDLPPLEWGPVTRVLVAAAPPDQTLQVTPLGAGSGRITSDPAGIDCGLRCSQSFPGAIRVALSAAAADGAVFAGWGGACTGTGDCAVTMNGARAVTATFRLTSPGDRDGDLMPDQWELENGLNPDIPDGNQDLDRDGAPNLLEYQSGTRPQNAADIPAALSLPSRGGWRARPK